MPAPALSGPQYLGEGLKLILSPGLRLFVLLPLTLNLVLFIALIGFAMQQFSGWVEAFMPSLPSWASFLEYLIWPLFVILVLLMVFFSFTMIANIIAAPFNGFLAEKVEVVVRGQDDFPPSAGPNSPPWCRALWAANCASWATSCHGPSAC
ncbi:hypothetical protein PSm6_10670 [Pseudomonas solani]|uniref:Sulfate transport protein CysZ n=1 Tax=Pseudomonas solani TaxID=2731552 RepID=A0ABM7L513_9PSED|nr:hypothetical protein PSm6_10670 [Pseudomonas solani]